MKKIIFLAVSIACMACVSQRDTLNKKPHAYKIGNVKVKPISVNEFAAQWSDKYKESTYSNIATISYYATDDRMLLVRKITFKESRARNFRDRYNDMKGLRADADFGSRLLMEDSVTVNGKWIYALESVRRDTTQNKNHGFFIEADKVQFVMTLKDPQQRATAIGLMDAFTMELMNVKLHLKPYKK